MALSIAPAEGQQNATQNPQSVPGQTVGEPSTQSGGVQPGTAGSLLTSSQGVGLGSQPLTAVSLSSDPTQLQTQTSSQPAVQPAHHVNPALFSVPVILCLAAAALFWAMARSAKSTTN